MKRFITYLYAYKDGQKMKNTGHIRVDVRNHVMNMQISIKDSDLENERGTFYIILKKETVSEIALEEIYMERGQYNGRISYIYDENIIGIRVCYENNVYMASCWKDGEEEIILNRAFVEQNEEVTQLEDVEEEDLDFDEQIIVAAMLENDTGDDFQTDNYEMFELERVYRKVNLNEIYTLPSRHWHFANNSFLIHGFWNYGYLVLKESMEENEKRMLLGVPGIFEEPEMVMAAYFGFPIFEALPSQVEEMEIGSVCKRAQEKNQQPQAGTFGCWFVSL